MPYDYIQRAYGVDLKAGDRVRHTVTGQEGRVIRARGDPYYFRVRFDDVGHTLNAHPNELVRIDPAPSQEPN